MFMKLFIDSGPLPHLEAMVPPGILVGAPANDGVRSLQHLETSRAARV